ncbi:MAG: hypothetical protein E6J05_01605 [Chloroflexi bacterium]|nr:MAG: hypothetical protein E6J05_01605 [Chloroflexota bacterium]
MKKVKPKSARPDVDAAERGGDWRQPMDGEIALEQATLKQALYWRQIYTEILVMEEQVLARIRQLMTSQSNEGRREVEQTNVPVVIAQAERFRQRRGYWEARVIELGGESQGEP